MIIAEIIKEGHEHYQPGQQVLLKRSKFEELNKKGIVRELSNYNTTLPDDEEE